METSHSSSQETSSSRAFATDLTNDTPVETSPSIIDSVFWSCCGFEGLHPRNITSVLDTVVLIEETDTKVPVGHKGSEEFQGDSFFCVSFDASDVDDSDLLGLEFVDDEEKMLKSGNGNKQPSLL